MPAGIVATVDGGYATIDFVDQSLRGPALADLLEIGGPDSIETITRRGPRRQYRVLVGNADAAGLLDGDEVARVPSAGQDSGAASTLVKSNPLSLDVVVTITATGGNWKYTYGSQPTAAVAFGVTATQLQTAIENLSNVAPGEVTVTQIATKTFAIHHTKRAAVSVASDTGTPLTGGTVTVTGGSGDDAADFHTPYDQHTSANAYVGDTTSAEERAMTPPRFTGTATPWGGTNAGETPTHAEVIAHVKEASAAPAGAQAARSASADDVVLHHPGHQANVGLAAIQPYEPTDPQGATTLPNDLKTPVEPETTEPEPLGGDGTETGGDEPPNPADTNGHGNGLETVKAYPDGEVSIDWRRGELDAYAADSPREIDTTDLPNKQAVFEAIVAREKELKT